MANKTYVHGTTLSAAISIVNEGFGYIAPSVWNCAETDRKAYFYDLDKYAEAECLDLETEQDIKEAMERMIKSANESGQIQNAILSRPEEKTAVIEIVVNEQDAQCFEPDSSCENMGDYGAVEILHEDINNIILNKKYISLRVHVFKFFPKLSYVYICGLVGNDHFLLDRLDSKDAEILTQVGRSLAECYNVFDEIVLDAEEMEVIEF